MNFSLASLAYADFVLANADECPAVPNGVVINKYYLENCGACQRLSPVINEIRNKLEKANVEVKYREIECTACECEGIQSFPTIEITRDKKPAGKTVGYKDYTKMSTWLAENLQLNMGIFQDQRIEHEEGNVTKLVARDFLSGFDGQWLVLFYENKNDKFRSHIKTLAAKYKNKVNIGEVTKNEAASVTNRFNINEYPSVFGINHGSAVPFSGEKTLEGLSKFTEKLATPNFESITYEGLRNESLKAKSGEPLYVVLYKNYEVASHYFNEMSQQFKFRARIYKSNDHTLFNAAGFHPKDITDFSDGNYDHNQMVKLLVYKNSTFYPCDAPVQNTNAIVEWIFHTHFSHISNINNENFYTIFHGMKPVIMLLTANEEFVEEFDRVSADRHLGTPYSNILFATLDTSEYPVFKQQVLSGVKQHTLAVYDPVKVMWYTDNTVLTKENFTKVAIKTIDKYFSNKLPVYPAKKSKLKYYMMAAWAVLIVGFFVIKTVSVRYKLE